MKIQLTTRFRKAAKKLPTSLKKELEKAINVVCKEPDIGEVKKGDLGGVRVYKFKMQKQLTLLAYVYDKDKDEIIITFVTFGSHENFYTEVKKYVN
ncbi:type II toxin-antitoxin system RelE/ParE family toxin [Piscirickettsia litoralis]|uniref:Addiction module toxin RelE n=1 Tax=Piscirickettsia litoralis TaxID=1891921 RepID=A0ABX2ZY57_9GAMM|nr:type II toxin-antitoxin system RelE/ParE family toxin [Piscirickettsia litoralis]ODN41531.1 hypothetical protein BGC07_15600 [Piscirickettsia litoralis]